MNKLLFLSSVLLLSLAAVAAADEIYVPANTPSTGRGNTYPFGSTSTEWRYQMVYNASLLGGKPFVVTDIAFSPNGTGMFTASAIEVRMSHSTQATSTTFDSNLPNPVVVLSTTNYTWNTTHQTWSPLGLAGLFHYNGVDRLTVEIRLLGTARSSFQGQCYSEPGHHDRVWAYGTGAWSMATGTAGLQSGLKTRFTVSTAQIVLAGTGQVGTTVDLNLFAPPDGGKAYQVGTSLGNGPIPIGTRSLGLSPDSLLVVSVSGVLPGLFLHYAGMLDTSGQAVARAGDPQPAGPEGRPCVQRVRHPGFRGTARRQPRLAVCASEHPVGCSPARPGLPPRPGCLRRPARGRGKHGTGFHDS